MNRLLYVKFLKNQTRSSFSSSFLVKNGNQQSSSDSSSFTSKLTLNPPNQPNRSFSISLSPSSSSSFSSKKSPSLVKMLSGYDKFTFRTYEEEVNVRRRQARHSVLVRYSHKNDLNRLIEDFELLGCMIKNVFVFEERSLLQDKSRTFSAALVELARLEDVMRLVNNKVRHLNPEYLTSYGRIFFYRVFREPKMVKPHDEHKTRNNKFNLDNVNYFQDGLNKFDIGFSAIHKFLCESNSRHQILNFYKRFVLFLAD